jgi:hypothetical protein
MKYTSFSCVLHFSCGWTMCTLILTNCWLCEEVAWSVQTIRVWLTQNCTLSHTEKTNFCLEVYRRLPEYIFFEKLAETQLEVCFGRMGGSFLLAVHSNKETEITKNDSKIMTFCKFGFFCLLKCEFKFVEKCTTSVVEVHFLGVFLASKFVFQKICWSLGATLFVTEVSFLFTDEFTLLDGFGQYTCVFRRILKLWFQGRSICTYVSSIFMEKIVWKFTSTSFGSSLGSQCLLLQSSGAYARPPRPSALVAARELVTWASGPPPLAASTTPTQVVHGKQRFSPCFSLQQCNKILACFLYELHFSLMSTQ